MGFSHEEIIDGIKQFLRRIEEGDTENDWVNVPYILMDEPLAGLDPMVRDSIIK